MSCEFDSHYICYLFSLTENVYDISGVFLNVYQILPAFFVKYIIQGIKAEWCTWENPYYEKLNATGIVSAKKKKKTLITFDTDFGTRN